MPADSIVRARVEPELKKRAEAILAAKGLTVSEALRQMLMHIVRDGAIPFELIVREPAPINEKRYDIDNIVTAEMLHHSAVSTINYFGFRGNRAAISLLYARPEGASQAEVNDAGRALGSPQKNYLNLLHQAIEWGHVVWIWDDPRRRGQVYKLVYNPKHSGRGAVEPPANWREMNVLKTPPGVRPILYRPHRS